MAGNGNNNNRSLVPSGPQRVYPRTSGLSSIKAGVAQAISAGLRGFAFPNSSGFWGNWPRLYPSADRFDYEQAAGSPRQNSIVMNTVQWVMRVAPSAPLRVRKQASQKIAPNHRLSELVSRPNPFYSGNLLLQATLADYNITGNAYWLKARNANGNTVQLWWIPSFMIRPAWPIDGSEYITKYVYEIYSKRFLLNVEDVVHFRFGMDPENIRLGLSPIAALFREIFTDNEAADFSAAVLRNMAVPSVVISPAPVGGDERTVFDDPEAVKALYKEKFSGSKRGEPLVMDMPTQVQVLSFTPEQLNLKEMRRVPEERVSGAIGVPAVVVGLGAGLDRSTFTNMESAEKWAWNHNIIPSHAAFSDTLNTQLLPELGNPGTEETFYDTSDVPALRPDLVTMGTAAVTVFKGGVAKRAEARKWVNLEAASDGSDDVYFTDIQRVNAQARMLGGGNNTGMNNQTNTGGGNGNGQGGSDNPQTPARESGPAGDQTKANGHKLLTPAEILAELG